jgi:hypothetical protein
MSRAALAALDMAIAITEELRVITACKQPAWTRRAEAKLERELKGLLGTVFDQTVQELLKHKVMPADLMAQRAITGHILGVQEDYARILDRNVHRAALHGREEIAELLPGRLEFDDFAVHTKQALREYVFIASERTISRMAGDVMGELVHGYEGGLGINQIAENLKLQFDGMMDWELKRVARTEINSFQNVGAYLTEKELGVEYHQWWTAEDERVRETEQANHVEMHAQIVKLGERFSNGLEYPGDRNGPLEEFINCRCRIVPFFIPEGMRAPTGKPYFYPEDLVDAAEPDKEISIADETFAEQIKSKLAAVDKRDYDSQLRILQDDIEAGIQRHLAKGGDIEGILPQFDKTKAPDFMHVDEMRKVGELLPKRGATAITVNRELSDATGWLSERVHPEMLLNAGRLDKIAYKAKGRACYAKAARAIKNWGGQAEVFVHEYGHHLHYQAGGRVFGVTRSFMKQRITGKPLEFIAGSKKEFGYKGFIDHYAGRVYGWENKTSPDGTEIISMGLQYMMRNPRWFYDNDPGHFRLIYALQRGLLR